MTGLCPPRILPTPMFSFRSLSDEEYSMLSACRGFEYFGGRAGRRGSSEGLAANPATTPAPRNDAWWQQRHESMNARVKKGNVDLIFIGDSITHGWEGGGKDVWQQFYGNRNAVNLGIGGDQTCHVLWRLDHGNIDGISPKLAVIMIGTNNAGNAAQSAEQIAAGVKAIVDKLRTKLPQTKILLLAIFPRGADNKTPSARST